MGFETDIYLEFYLYLELKFLAAFKEKFILMQKKTICKSDKIK